MASRKRHHFPDTPESQRLGQFFHAAVVVAFFIAGLSVLPAAFPEWLKDHPSLKQWILALWIVGPPAWFVIEWSILLKKGDTMEDGEFERHKHTSSLFTKLWLAVATVVAGAYYGNELLQHFGPHRE
jgi:hypothetical protein